MTYAHLLLLLKARWRTVAIVMAIAAAIPIGAAMLVTKRYTATASVVLDVKSPDPIAGMVLPGMTVSGYMATQVDVLQSERVAMRAIRAVGLEDNATLKTRWQEITEGRGNFRAWTAETILRGLDVRPSRDSNVIAVAYTSEDPEFSAALANAFVRAYIDTTLELRVEPAKQYNSFFDDRAKASREALEQAQLKLSAYQQRNGILVTDERLDVENQRLAELTTQFVALQALAAETGSRHQQASGRADRLQEVLNNPLVGGLTAELVRQEARLDEMKSQRGDEHPQVQELRASIAQLKDRIETETGRVAASIGLNNDINVSRATQLKREIEQQRARLLRLKSLRDEAAVLQRDVENAQRAYDGILARTTQSSMESQNTQTNVSVLKSASPPAFPSSPRLGITTAAALLLGLLLAIGAVLARERIDRRMRTEDDVLLALQQPLLGVLPVRHKKNIKGASRLRLTGALKAGGT